jgi:hypothetical protein
MYPMPAISLPVFGTLVLVAAGLMQNAQAQSSCSSDGQSRPVLLLERFINADCADCWTDRGTLRAGRGELALDWVLPGSRADDAPLSAVATRDALKRLEALGMAAPPGSANRKTRVQRPSGTLRVAHGLHVAGYIGASIALKPLSPNPPAPPGTAWLALVETIPVGVEGTPVARNLVRNVLQTNWDGRKQLSKEERSGFFESRVMDVPAGMNPDRALLIGWVQDAQGRIVAAARSRCVSRP